ncbi:ABC1 kinase family protein [Actinokineospora iranica]|uniref:Ubiquinone biosynthesis protein n=1 Tax=Actinokineospora iranica TaxID=1271860 RepID=A0A1G6VUB9_9PSEU|nr:AarF/UbiB family protein [Actinokineospora iranica]SDD57003.1 ubiquinone biosynthesis protein [Actinokineospora iranica]
MSRSRLRVLTGAVSHLLAAEARRAVSQRDSGDESSTLGQQRAREFRRTLERLGPFYIKVGQMLSTRPDVVSQDMIDELRKLHDRVSVAPFALFEPVLEAELGPRWERRFADVDIERPLGAASLAQVYAVTLADGRPAVIKVQRPDIGTLVRSDMALLRRLVKLAGNRSPRFTAVVDLPAMLDIVFDAMRAELDFTVEAQNMATARAVTSEFKYLHIPDVLQATPRVMIQSRAPGCSIRDADPATFTDDERVGIGRDLFAYAYRSYFVEKFFHADLHPGNIFVHPGEKASLIDWGMVGRIDRRTSMALMLMLMNLAMNDGTGIARAWIEFGHATAWADIPSFINDMQALAPKVTHASLAELDFGVTLTNLLKCSTKRGIRTNPTVALLGKSVANLEGSIRHLTPELGITETFKDEVAGLMAKLACEFTSEQQLARVALDTAFLGDSLVEQSRTVLKDAANRQLTVQIGRPAAGGKGRALHISALALAAFAVWRSRHHNPP